MSNIQNTRIVRQSPKTSNDNSPESAGEVDPMSQKPVHQRAQGQQNLNRLKKTMNREQKQLAHKQK